MWDLKVQPRVLTFHAVITAHLILLDQGKAVAAEEGGAAVDGVRGTSIDLCRLLLVDRRVPMLLQLWRQELRKVVALHLLRLSPHHKHQRCYCRSKGWGLYKI